MATNLQKLRAKKAANQKKETTLSASFTIDEGTPETPEENSITPSADDKSISRSVSYTEETPEAQTSSNPIIDNHSINESIPDSNNAPERNRNSDSGNSSVNDRNSDTVNNSIKDSKPVKAINPINPIIPINSADTPVPEKNLGLRLASEEDKRYLDLAPLSRSMTKKAFFISLLEKEFAETDHININDSTVEQYRNTSLKTTAITISVPITMIEQIKTYSAKYMMKYQRYIAYVINKARLTDQEWMDAVR